MNNGLILLRVPYGVLIVIAKVSISIHELLAVARESEGVKAVQGDAYSYKTDLNSLGNNPILHYIYQPFRQVLPSTPES